MKSHCILLSTILSFGLSTTHANESNQPELLNTLSGKNMEVMSQHEQQSIRAERFFNQAGDAVEYCRIIRCHSVAYIGGWIQQYAVIKNRRIYSH